jgi:HEPN domain-containing protein
MRISDARALLKARRFAGAYYLAGYAIECTLKARIAQNTRRYDFPPRDSDKNYTHSIEALFKRAGLDVKFDADRNSNLTLDAYWHTVKDWNEHSRYNESIKQKEAEDLIEAITHPHDGILEWIEKN